MEERRSYSPSRDPWHRNPNIYNPTLKHRIFFKMTNLDQVAAALSKLSAEERKLVADTLGPQSLADKQANAQKAAERVS